MGAIILRATKPTPAHGTGTYCIPGVEVYIVTGTATVIDPKTGATYQQEQRKPYTGWFVTISQDLPELDKHSALVDVTDAAMVFQPNFLGRDIVVVKADVAVAKASGKATPKIITAPAADVAAPK